MINAATDDFVVIQGAGGNVVAVINDEYYNAVLEYLEELEDLRDAQLAEKIGEEIRTGKMKTIPWEQVKEELRRKKRLDE
jgi:hypothetical protein